MKVIYKDTLAMSVMYGPSARGSVTKYEYGK